MRLVKREVQTLVSEAAKRAYPVTLVAELRHPSASQDCDLVSPLPRTIYEKYQRDGVCFGLYNAREIADGVFVHVQRSTILKTVKIS
jgi:hypothetical protein